MSTQSMPAVPGEVFEDVVEGIGLVIGACAAVLTDPRRSEETKLFAAMVLEQLEKSEVAKAIIEMSGDVKVPKE